MSTALLLLRNLRVPSLHRVRALKSLGIGEWIGDQGYVAASSITGGKLILSFTDQISYASAIAADVIRTSNASFETVSSINRHRVFPKSLGWALIKAYYGSYFAAHAIMRAYCYGVVKLEAGHIGLFAQAVCAAGLNNDGSMVGGYYSINLDSANGQIEFSLIGTNPHESLWRGFLEFLNVMSLRIQAGPGLSEEKGQMIAFLSEIRDGISPMLPSQIRNKLNYRQEYGVWYPFSGFDETTGRDLVALLERWGEKPTILAPACRETKETKRLASLAVCLVALLRETILDIESSRDLGRAFAGRRSTGLLSKLLSTAHT